MKKLFLVLASIGLLVSCSDSSVVKELEDDPGCYVYMKYKDGFPNQKLISTKIVCEKDK